MQKFKNQLSRIDIRNFPLFYIGAVVIIMLSGYLVRNYREIEEYKKLTLWYENLEPDNKYQSSGELSEFIQEAQKKLESDFISTLSNPNKRITNDIDKKIIFSNQELPKDTQDKYVTWNIEKTGETLNAYYDYVDASDFSGQQANNSPTISNKLLEIRKDKVFLKFMEQMINNDKIKNHLKSHQVNNKDMKIDNLNIFTRAIMKYLADDAKYIKSMPSLRINTIYLTNVNTGFMLSYPLTDQRYQQGVDFKSRPWFKATQNDKPGRYGYSANFIKDEKGNITGITGVYIDINDRKNPNAIRTLFYRFKNDLGQEYILCIDLFFDKSSQFSSQLGILDLLKQYVRSGLYIEKDDNLWIYLIPYSFILAVILFLVYEMKAKYILLRMLNFNGNNLLKIKLERNPKQTHNTSAKPEIINITITGMTGQKNESQISREAGWKAEFNPLQAGVGISQTNTHQQESAYSYQLSNTYNLDITDNNLRYRRVETWEVKLLAKIINQTIGHFVITWEARDTERLGELLEIQSVYWEKEYENYLDSIKSQLREHLLTSDAGELVPVMDTNYSIHQNIPSLIEQINSLEKLVHNSLYLKEGRIAFSEVNTLKELYQHNGVQVKAICTIDFLKKLSDDQQLQDFFTVNVKERYFIEYKENQKC
jgi:hypothetical protein